MKTKACNGHPIINLEEAEKLAALNCTNDEIAAFFGVSRKAVEQRYTNDLKFRELIEQGRAKGRISVRRRQMQLLEAGNATMGIWLGKQLLGQRDYQSLEVGGIPGGEPVQSVQKVIVEYVDTPHSTPELA